MFKTIEKKYLYSIILCFLCATYVWFIELDIFLISKEGFIYDSFCYRKVLKPRSVTQETCFPFIGPFFCFFIVPIKSNFFLENSYLFILIYIFFCFLVTCVLFVLSFFLYEKNLEFEKETPYECGFEPFGNARSLFYPQYYLVAILFLIFDVELIFIFPWAVSLGVVGLKGFLAMCKFLFILVIGFIYEWRSGTLDWV